MNGIRKSVRRTIKIIFALALFLLTLTPSAMKANGEKCSHLRRSAAYFLDSTLALMLAITLLLWIFPRHFPRQWELIANSGAMGRAGIRTLLSQLGENDGAAMMHLFAATQFVMIATLTAYFWLSEVFIDGGSIGKCMFRLRVADFSSGNRPDLLRLFMRSAMSSICLTVCSPLLLPNFLCALFRRDRRCFHDLLAGTAVVRN
ncbi:MAG: RDD family protein [Puniceicoccales bacterium]|nr:RDD family protein [Puniceicoccales bacterium]